ncbi:MAG: hypothetical protein AAGA23_20910 [Pseudomonadota bacterium]
MAEPLSRRLLMFVARILATVPWLLAMYLFYWLDSSGTWTVETPHRGKLSVMILGTGMLLSFFAHSLLLRKRQ